MTSPLSTPVAFLIFNRPETTARVFEEIRRARPPKLLVVADGPRADRSGEPERCAAAREITEAVDWECELLREYSEANLGCRRRVSSGLDWVFETVEEAIVLEDDCLPHPTFFRFCEELLDRYRADERVMHISGDNFQGRGFAARTLHDIFRAVGRPGASYYASRYPHVWGWASWRRAWRHYDVEMTGWRGAADRSPFLSHFSDPAEREFWEGAWEGSSRGDIDTWDFQWAFACMSRNTSSLMPRVNLVSNIGFSQVSTHSQPGSPLADLPVEAMEFPLIHPRSLARDESADRRTARVFFRN